MRLDALTLEILRNYLQGAVEEWPTSSSARRTPRS